MQIRGFLETSFLDPETLQEKSLEEIGNFILNRKDFIDGIVITGGEPTLQSDLPLAKYQETSRS